MSENQMTNSYETFAEKTTDLQPKIPLSSVTSTVL